MEASSYPEFARGVRAQPIDFFESHSQKEFRVTEILGNDTGSDIVFANNLAALQYHPQNY